MCTLCYQCRLPCPCCGIISKNWSFPPTVWSPDWQMTASLDHIYQAIILLKVIFESLTPKQRLCYRLEEVAISYQERTSVPHLQSVPPCVSRCLSAVVSCVLPCPNLTFVLQFLHSQLRLTCCSGLFWHVYTLLLSSFSLSNLLSSTSFC